MEGDYLFREFLYSLKHVMWKFWFHAEYLCKSSLQLKSAKTKYCNNFY